MLFVFGVLFSSLLLIQLEFAISLIPMAIIMQFGDFHVAGETLTFLFLAILMIGHLRATYLTCNNLGKRIAEIMDNKQRNQLWIGMLWRLTVEWSLIKRVILLK